MLNRLSLLARLSGLALAVTLAESAFAELPAPPLPLGSNRPRIRVRDEARPMPSAVRERLEHLKERRLERLREREKERERIQSVSEEYERSVSRPDADPKLLRDKQDELFSLRTERRREHRAALRKRWGTALAEPAMRAELEIHARRTARLRRLQFLAATETKGKKRAALLARIDKAFATEKARHARALARAASGDTGSGSPAPSGSAAPAAVTAPSAAPAASGGTP